MPERKKPFHKRKKLKRAIVVLVVLFVVFVLSSNLIINFYSDKYVFNIVADVPHNKVGLVLGTSKKVASGNLNYYFKYRIDAAVKLFESGKIDYILVSGDNATKEYNEPRDMLNALLAAGIPREKIVLDYAGFRTLDSIIRCKEVFGQETFTIISQKFHNERAVFLAHAHGINATAFNARDVQTRNGIKTRVRELFARSKVFIDLLIEKQPKFLGEKITIGEEK
ncbi:vancomycin high temperature exclusion protein [bacterium]|nr:vancomycin high temperature exclusion protein [bacterium]